MASRNTAVADDVIPVNPCRVRGAGQAKRARTIEPASLAELEAIVHGMPSRYKLMALLAAWCAMRFGDLERAHGFIGAPAGLSHTYNPRAVMEAWLAGSTSPGAAVPLRRGHYVVSRSRQAGRSQHWTLSSIVA